MIAIFDKVTVTTAHQLNNTETNFNHDIVDAVTVRELYEIVKNKAMKIAEELEMMNQGRGRIGVEMVEGAGGLPCADIRCFGEIRNQVFCTE